MSEVPSNQPGTPVHTFNYKVIEIDRSLSMADIEAQFNELGADGWHLDTVDWFSNQTRIICVFEQELY